MDHNIFYLNYDDLSEFESHSKGFRSDIYVQISHDYFKLYIYDLIRLTQDFETEFTLNGFFDIEPNIVLVKEVKLIYIKSTIRHLYRAKYFDKIKPSIISNGVRDQLVKIDSISNSD